MIYVFKEPLKLEYNDYELAEEFGVNVEFVKFRKELTEELKHDGYLKNFIIKRNIKRGLKMIDEISQILKSSESLPFLFIGSGFSRRYMNAPNWEELLKLVAAKIGVNKYAQYNAQSQAILNANYSYCELMTSIADLIEKDLSDIWYTEEKFKESRYIYSKELSDGTSALKIEISRIFKELSENQESYLLKDEIELLKKLSEKSIAGIITTNYDNMLQNIFDFKVFIGQDDLMFSHSYELCEIYKIHGCCLKPESLIINTRDYSRFNEKSQYLAAKLLTIFVENPIIFIGYGINDQNIKNIIKSLIICSGDKLTTIQNKFIFIDYDSKLEQNKYATSNFIINYEEIGKSISIKTIKLNNYNLLYETILNNYAKHPVKLLRRIKEDIYNLVLTNDKNSKLLVLADKEAFDDNNKDIEYVVGFGVTSLGKRGYESICAIDLFKDILYDNEDFINNYLVKFTIPKLLKSNTGSVPIYKYIHNIEYEELDETIKKYIKNDIKDFKNNTILNQKVKERTVTSIIENNEYTIERKLLFVSAKINDNQNIDELYNFITSILDENNEYLEKGRGKSDLRRLIKIYDWLKYYKKN